MVNLVMSPGVVQTPRLLRLLPPPVDLRDNELDGLASEPDEPVSQPSQ